MSYAYELTIDGETSDEASLNMDFSPSLFTTPGWEIESNEDDDTGYDFNLGLLSIVEYNEQISIEESDSVLTLTNDDYDDDDDESIYKWSDIEVEAGEFNEEIHVYTTTLELCGYNKHQYGKSSGKSSGKGKGKGKGV